MRFGNRKTLAACVQRALTSADATQPSKSISYIPPVLLFTSPPNSYWLRKVPPATTTIFRLALKLRRRFALLSHEYMDGDEKNATTGQFLQLAQQGDAIPEAQLPSLMRSEGSVSHEATISL